MPVSVFLQGLTMGLAYVAPIGMQNMFVINAAASGVRRRAVATALCVTAMDISLTLACFFGVGAVLDAVPWLSRAIQLVGGVLVAAIGVGLMRARPERDAGEAGAAGGPAAGGGAPKAAGGASATGGAPRAGEPPVFGARDVGKTLLTAFVVTWLNPQALLDGTMMLGAFRATFPGPEGLWFVAGAVCASLAWFSTVSLVVGVLGSRFTDRVLRAINLVCGAVVVLYGVRLLLAFVFGALGLG